MRAWVSVGALTGPWRVSMALSFHMAMPLVLVCKSGCSVSKAFFFCSCNGRSPVKASQGAQQAGVLVRR